VRLFSDVSTLIDDPYLARAASLALRGVSATAPNPAVGCVIVRDGEVVGEGYHARAGEPHAEAIALLSAGHAARGADAYVTLEPCAHYGRTPPCADALIEAGVRSVTIGMPDPTSQAGGGAEKLRDAGIRVTFAENPAPFEDLNTGWLSRVRCGRPFVTAKVGLSLDARPALQSGKRASMTGADGREVTRRLRAASDAVLVSAATVIADDPALTVRSASGELAERQPLRVVLVREHPPQPNARVFTDSAAPTLILATGAPGVCDAFPPTIERHECSGYPLSDAFAALASRGVGELLVEPGPRLLSAMWSEGVIDRLVTVVSGGMAGAEAPDLFEGEPDAAAERLVPRFVPREAGIVGSVSVTVWEPTVGVGTSVEKKGSECSPV
jgi:diaminohydroxyphosphoribosylaminopyrimidine deaminase/5-amino-6-(5-phosphoribosylamino)uracil reductase